MTTETPDYQQLRDCLIARACRLGLARHDAEDLAQDTLIIALTRAQSLSGNDLRHWCFVVLRNFYFSQYRSGASRVMRRAVSIHDDDSPLEFPVAASQENAVLVSEAMRALQALPERSQRLLRMVTVEGTTYEEAAAAEQLNVGTLKSALHRAQTAWRERLTQHPRRPSLAA